MNKSYDENYIHQADKIEQFILEFEFSGKLVGDGDRNKIKIFDLEGLLINIKSFKIPGLINKIVYKYFRKSKARRSFEYANILISKGIRTPKPIAYLENSTFLGLKQSYYICEHLSYDLTFRNLVTDPNYIDHENILRQFTEFTWRLHEKEIYFKDHSPGNTLIVKENTKYHFYLIDLNRMSFSKLDFESRMKNFSRLTPKMEMIELMSDEYAKLSGLSYEIVLKTMWLYTQRFQEKFHRKKRLKKKLLGKK